MKRDLIRTTLAQAPTVLVLLLLGGLAYVGYRTNWKLSQFKIFGGGGAAQEKDETERRVSTFNAETTVKPDPSQDPIVQKECPIAGLLVEFPSPETARQIGLQFATVRQKPLSAKVTVPGEIIYDATRVTRVSARASGGVEHIYKVVGDRVKVGEVLALVNSARVGDSKAALLEALAEADLKEKTLVRLRSVEAAVAGKLIVESEAALTVARIRLVNARQALLNLGLPVRLEDMTGVPAESLSGRLRFLGLPSHIKQELDHETASSNLLPITAPFDGVVVERNVGAGEVVDTSDVLFVVADVSRVWVTMNVAQEDADRLALDQQLAFYPDGHPGEVIRGKVSWISTTVDEKTRTQQARAVAENPEEHWRANIFGRAEITIRQNPQAVVVPSTAVQQEGTCRAVFVRLSDRMFAARRVQVGVQDGGHTEITAGVNLGEIVVTIGSHVLKSEILKSKLGGGAD